MRNVYRQNRLIIIVFLLLFLAGFPLLCAAGTISGKVIGRVDKGRKDAVVYLEGVSGDFPPTNTLHRLDQRGKVYVPHVQAILKGERVAMLNNDPFLHNVHIYSGRKTIFNLAMLKDSKQRKKTFEEAGEYLVLCDVHAEMEAWIIVLENPYFAKTDEEGNYKIENVPGGTYIIKAWDKKLKAEPQEITVDDDGNSRSDFTLQE